MGGQSLETASEIGRIRTQTHVFRESLQIIECDESNYLYNNCCVINDYAHIVVRVEDIVHDPKGSSLCLQPSPLYGIVIANTTLLLLLC